MRRTISYAASAAIVAGLLTAAPATATTSTPTPDRLAVSAVVPAATVAANARVRRVLPKRIAASRPLGTNRAVRVVDLTTMSVLHRSRDRVPMRGASTTKLATAVTTLSLFDPADRPWATTVVTGRGPREVVLVAGGDPMLTSSQLRALAQRTARTLAPVIAPAPIPPTDPEPDPDPTTTATPTPTPTPDPEPRQITVSVRVDDTLYPSPTRARGWPSHYLPWVVAPVRPLVRDLRAGWDTSADTARYFSEQLGIALRTRLETRTDITVLTRYRGRLEAPDGAQEISRFAGNSVGAALRWMLLVSDNDVAEMLFRNNAIGLGRRPTWPGARLASTERLASLGVDVRDWLLYDGSGVSRADRLTARGLVSLLRVAQSPRHPELHALRGYLPVSGVSGTLDDAYGRYATAPTRCARGKVQAKTGTLFDTVGLAGYATGSDGRLRAFAVLVNNPRFPYPKLTVRRAVDRIPATLTGCF
jgi:D-alanyl-D-alanine carboxypeptidase/D-alanyl-D-alanine-endopeptidase (penicillin-binding protein 4)